MSGTSETSPRQTSTDLHNVTFSQALADGRAVSEGLIGPTTDQPGQARVHASHFLLPERVEGLMTRDIAGPLFGGSSPSADLQASLASRLQAATDVNGSPEYLLTWRQWDMFAGLQICALRASGRRKSASDCSGWPTVVASEVRQGYQNRSDPNKKGTQKSLSTVAVDVLTGPIQSGGPAATGKQGEFPPDMAGWKLNPRFSLWLMGYPDEWACCGERAMQSSRKSRKRSSKQQKAQG
jgi:hypothetical protein